jgi:hypothetical protein
MADENIWASMPCAKKQEIIIDVSDSLDNACYEDSADLTILDEKLEFSKSPDQDNTTSEHGINQCIWDSAAAESFKLSKWRTSLMLFRQY